MTTEELNRINTSVLAYLGDAVYELMIREHLIGENPYNVDRLHRTAVGYVSAEGQAIAARAMISRGFLTEEEECLLRRARNHRVMSRSASADIRDYKVATGFEALIGYLHLDGQKERLAVIVDEAIRIIDEVG